MAKIFQIASVLYEVLKTVVPAGETDEKTERYAKDVENKKEQYVHYNILPLYAVGVKPAIMEFPEIKAALNALRNVDNLPMPRIHMTDGGPDDSPVVSTERVKSINDVLDWLSSIFGFQVGQACRPLLKRVGFWDSLVELARAYDYMMGLIVFLPITILSWIPVVSELQTRMLFHQALSRDLQISVILAGRKDKAA